jgi:hypothetical protein
MEDAEAEAWAEAVGDLLKQEESRVNNLSRTSELLARNDRIFNG